MRYKKYIVFGYDQYYPLGGLSDLKESFSSSEEAVDYINKSRAEDNGYRHDFYDIVDRDSWEEVVSNYREEGDSP